jgi:hypothetical protein
MKTPLISVLADLFPTVMATLAKGLLLSSTIRPVKFLDTSFPKFKGVSTEFPSIPESLLQLLNKKGTNKTKIKSLFDIIMSLF